MARYEFAAEIVHIFMRNLSILPAKQPERSLMSHSIPDRPWSKIAADPFEFKGEHYLVLADYYSDWIEFDKMRDQTATETTALLLNDSHDGDFLMRLSLTTERISIRRNSHNSVRGSR